MITHTWVQGSNYFFVHGGSSPPQKSPREKAHGGSFSADGGSYFNTNFHWIGTHETPKFLFFYHYHVSSTSRVAARRFLLLLFWTPVLRQWCFPDIY